MNADLIGYKKAQEPQSLLPLRAGERAGVRCCLLLALLTQLSTLNSQLSAATFTNNVTITETNTTYDGQDIVISGATVTIDGPHSFNSVLLTNNAVLTHSPCTTTNTHKLDLVVTNEIVVSTNSRIDVSGKGYLPGRTSGNVPGGGRGGSHGGLGGLTGHPVYGDYASPDDWGSGGNSAPGGGLVRITADTMVLDGNLWANGAGYGGTDAGGAGAGGGIYGHVRVLAGISAIAAAGGAGNGYVAGGGGGRVAMYAADFSGFNTNAITAYGGPGIQSPLGNGNGGVGTVYLRDRDEPQGTLVIDAGSGGSGVTPLGLPGSNTFTVPVPVVLRGSRTLVRPEHPGMALSFAGGLRIESSARFEVEAPLSVGGGAVVDNATLVVTNLQANSL